MRTEIASPMIKYQHPTNPDIVWSGVGRKPVWLVHSEGDRNQINHFIPDNPRKEVNDQTEQVAMPNLHGEVMAVALSTLTMPEFKLYLNKEQVNEAKEIRRDCIGREKTCNLLKITPYHLGKLTKAGIIPHVIKGGGRAWRKSEIEKFVGTDLPLKPKPRVYKEPTPPKPFDPPIISDSEMEPLMRIAIKKRGRDPDCLVEYYWGKYQHLEYGSNLSRAMYIWRTYVRDFQNYVRADPDNWRTTPEWLNNASMFIKDIPLE